jgi:hypothetical protein
MGLKKDTGILAGYWQSLYWVNFLPVLGLRLHISQIRISCPPHRILVNIRLKISHSKHPGKKQV